MRNRWRLVLVAAAVLAGGLIPVQATAAETRPDFKAPWPCGQQRQYYHHSSEVTNALDFNIAGSGDLGTPALASAAGTVTQVVRGDSGYGNHVRVSHGGQWTSMVAHLDSISVSQGQQVRAGQELGKVGSTGNSSGPHLHYEQEYAGVNQRIVIDGVALQYTTVVNHHTSRNCGGGEADRLGVYRPENGRFYFRGGGEVQFGNLGDVPVTGDWNRDGVDTIGTYRPSNQTFYLRNSNTRGNADGAFRFGNPGDVPLVGDWDGDGYDTISVWRPANQTFYLKNRNDNDGTADGAFKFGQQGDIPVVGDWDGDGYDTIGVYRPSNRTFYLKNRNNNDGTVDGAFTLGNHGDKPVIGNWDGDPYDTIGVYRPSNWTFYLKNRNNDDGTADVVVPFGNTGDIPLSGRWS